jgi:hypothetical protein
VDLEASAPGLDPDVDLEASAPGLDPDVDLEASAPAWSGPGLDLASSAIEPPELEPLPEPAPAPRPAARAPELVDLSAAGGGAPQGARPLKRMDAIPLQFEDDVLILDVGERGKAALGLERIDAVAVAGVRGLKPRPVVLIDLVTNWHAAGGEPLKVVRLRSDRFDPRKLVAGAGDGFAALKVWIAELLERSGAMALPDPGAVAGDPFRMFDDLASYEREVLRSL